jgi:hypothetical protein
VSAIHNLFNILSGYLITHQPTCLKIGDSWYMYKQGGGTAGFWKFEKGSPTRFVCFCLLFIHFPLSKRTTWPSACTQTESRCYVLRACQFLQFASEHKHVSTPLKWSPAFKGDIFLHLQTYIVIIKCLLCIAAVNSGLIGFNIQSNFIFHFYFLFHPILSL